MILTTWERVSVANVINAQQGDMRLLQRCLRLLAVFDFGPVEQAEIGMVISDGVTRWRDTQRTWEIEVSADDKAVLKGWLENYTWQAANAKWVLALIDKF